MWGWLKRIKLIRKKEMRKVRSFIFCKRSNRGSFINHNDILTADAKRAEICTQDSSSLPSDISFWLPKGNPRKLMIQKETLESERYICKHYHHLIFNFSSF